MIKIIKVSLTNEKREGNLIQSIDWINNLIILVIVAMIDTVWITVVIEMTENFRQKKSSRASLLLSEFSRSEQKKMARCKPIERERERREQIYIFTFFQMRLNWNFHFFFIAIFFPRTSKRRENKQTKFQRFEERTKNRAKSMFACNKRVLVFDNYTSAFTLLRRLSHCLFPRIFFSYCRCSVSNTIAIIVAQRSM